jgi:hypothetical protein
MMAGSGAQTVSTRVIVMAQQPGSSAASVLKDLQSFPWSDAEATAYEVALDTISLVIAWYSARLSEERQSRPPDQGVIDHLAELRRRAVQDHRALSPIDPATAKRLQATYGALLRRLSGEEDARG